MGAKRRSIPALVLGIIGALLLMVTGGVCMFMLYIILSLVIDLGGTFTWDILIQLFIMCVPLILSFVAIAGAVLCVKKSRIGGLILLIVSVMTLMFGVYFILINIDSLSNVILYTLSAFISFPFTLSAGILGLTSKKEVKPKNEQTEVQTEELPNNVQ